MRTVDAKLPITRLIISTVVCTVEPNFVCFDMAKAAKVFDCESPFSFRLEELILGTAAIR